MVSEFLNNRRVFETDWMADESYDPQVKAMVDKLVDRLVLIMRISDAAEKMPLDAIERMVIRSFRAAEYKYYGLDMSQLMMVAELERINAKGREGNK